MRAVSLYILLALGLTGCSSFRSSKCCSSAEEEKKPPKTLLAWQPGEDEKKGDSKDEKGDEKKDESPKPDEAGEAKVQFAAFRKDTPGKDSKADGDGNSKREIQKQEKPEELDTIVTDRPDFTEASSTVGKGRILLEGGYTFSRNRETGVREDHSYPELLLRVGLFADWLEFRVGQNFSTARGFGPNGGPFDNSGGDDLYTGFKFGLTEQKKVLPEMALVIQTTIPTGKSSQTAGRMLPGMNLLYGWEVNDFLSLGGSSQGNASVDDGGHSYLLLAQSLTVGYTLTKKLGAYTEVFGFFPDGATAPGVGPEYYFNGGFTYKFTPNLQLDLRAGVGLNRQSDDYFVGTGFAVRY